LARSELNSARIANAPIKRERDVFAEQLKRIGAGEVNGSGEVKGNRSDCMAQLEATISELKIRLGVAERSSQELSWRKTAAEKYRGKARSAMAQLTASQFSLKVVVAELATMSKHAESQQQRQVQLQLERNAAANDSLEAEKVSKAMGRSLRVADAQCASMAETLDVAIKEAGELKADLDRVQAECDEVAGSRPDGRGRPAGHAGRAAIEAKWSTYRTLKARNEAIRRHQTDIVQVLKEGRCNDWLPASLAGALESTGMIDDLWGTRLFAKRRWKFAQELAEVLQAEWNVELALYCKLDVELSDSQYAKLRLAFCKQYNGKAWLKRTWYR
jgi:hypothetical protein